ncbi:NAD(P)H-dependent oxidoreductase [Streptomyces sp. NR30]|uniref:NAD(P)H-dependent oxidoreductase n=1 Tax=Streptomyces guryensis TaxID=2886947 RepID=A0A9Q3Z9F0_9ACTN|nr:NAD(P)H-dependent oxidoreductase [Streptomyces guryensis]MCD9880256.1 NAD(P)H-dependent oxidoreductase [Streptomyces guryensis]
MGIILGSTRPGRRGEPIASWVLDTARAHGGADYELIDLAQHGLGTLDEGGNPTHQQYGHPHTRDWSALIDDFDGFLFLVPEYNHSFPGALKNALDHIYREWNDKAAGIISYGGWAAGVRAAEALRLVLAELQVATVRAQPAVALIPAFATGAFIPAEGLASRSATCSTRSSPGPACYAAYARPRRRRPQGSGLPQRNDAQPVTSDFPPPGATAYHRPSFPCPFTCPAPVSPTYRYNGQPPRVSCFLPSRWTVPRRLFSTPTVRTESGTMTGIHVFTHSPAHVHRDGFGRSLS